MAQADARPRGPGSGIPVLGPLGPVARIGVVATVLVAIAAVGAAVGISALIALDGESNWLEGALLSIFYIVLAISFFELR